MIKIFSGNNSDIATAEVINQLGRNNVAGSMHYVVVPDRFSLSVEKEIFERLDLPGACNIEVVSFTRLAVKVLKKRVSKCLSKEGAVIVLKRVIERVKDKLVHYGAVAAGNGFPKELYAVIASIRNCGYTVEDVEGVIPLLERGTKSKMQDVALLYREYIKEIEGNFEDSTTRIDKLIKEIPGDIRVAESDFYFVGFSTFSGKQRQVIEALAKRAKSVCVAVTATNFGKNEGLYPKETQYMLCDLAKEAGVDFEVQKVFGGVKEPFNTLNRNLFTHTGESFEFDEGEKSAVVVYREKNVFEEINGVAHEIARLVRREGYRYKDIAVVNCESGNAPIIRSVFARYGIPLYTDSKYPLNATVCCRYLIALLEVKIYNFRRDKVLNLVKEPLFDIGDDARENFENFVLKFNINFGRFESEFDVKGLKSEGGKKNNIERSRVMQAEAELVRATLCSAVKDIPESATCGDYCKIIKGILEEKFPEGYANALLGGSAEGYSVAVNEQAPRQVEAIVNELEELIGKDEMSLKKFANTLATSISALELSLIPQSIDSVFMGDLHESRYNKLRALFIICATADNLPVPHAYQAIISMTDMDRLCDNNFRLFPTPADMIAEEEYLLLELFTKVSDRLYIGGSMAGQDGLAMGESSVVKEIKDIMGLEEVSLFERYDLPCVVTESEQEDLAVSPDNAVFEFLSHVKQATVYGGKDAQTMANIYASLSPKQREKVDKLLAKEEDVLPPDPALYFAGKERCGARDTSVSEVECFYRCPYRHHLQYGLRLKEREEGELRVQDVGTFIHGALEFFFSATKGKLDGMSERELSDAADDAVKKAQEKFFKSDEDGMLDAVNRKAVVAEAKRTCLNLTEVVLRGKYRPTYMELGFGFPEHPEFPPIEVDTEGGKYIFRGSVDRVDTWGDKAIIIDYKTGHVEEKAMTGLYYGDKLQVFLYQDVAIGLGYTPSGTFYVPIRDTADKSKNKAVGELDLSKDNVEALDGETWRDYLKNGSATSPCYPISVVTGKKSKALEIKGGGRLHSAEDLANATETAKEMVKKAMEHIERGVITPSPLDGCGFCSFAPICKAEGTKRQRERIKDIYKTLEKQAEGGKDGDTEEGGN